METTNAKMSVYSIRQQEKIKLNRMIALFLAMKEANNKDTHASATQTNIAKMNENETRKSNGGGGGGSSNDSTICW